MGYRWRSYPKLEDRHLETARLFADRTSMIRAIAMTFRAKVVAEVGVAYGDFSQALLETFKPDEFVAFDLFDMEKFDVALGRDTREAFADAGGTHYGFYGRRFAAWPAVTLVKGPSVETLPHAKSQHFDLVYIDGDHSFEGCRTDADNAVRMLKDDGMIIFNDYTMCDVASGSPYGVIPVANDLVVNGGWEVVGLAMEASMYCDLAVRRPAASR